LPVELVNCSVTGIVPVTVIETPCAFGSVVPTSWLPNVSDVGLNVIVPVGGGGVPPPFPVSVKA